MERNEFERLSNHEVLEIAKWLVVRENAPTRSQIRDLVIGFGGTCKRFRALSVDAEIWRNIDVGEAIGRGNPKARRTAKAICGLAQIAACEKLRIDDAIPCKLIDALVRRMPRLKELSIADPAHVKEVKIRGRAKTELRDPRTAAESMIRAVGSLKELESLSLSNGIIGKMPVPVPSNLRSLEVRATQEIPAGFGIGGGGGEGMRQEETFPKVTSLELKICATPGTPMCIREAIWAFPNLTRLVLQLYTGAHGIKLAQADLDGILGSLGQLEAFSIFADSERVTLEALERAGCAPKLKKLSMSLSQLDGRSCHTIAKCCPNLTKLLLFRMAFPEAAEIRAIGRLGQMQSFTFNLSRSAESVADLSGELAAAFGELGRAEGAAGFLRFRISGFEFDATALFAGNRMKTVESLRFLDCDLGEGAFRVLAENAKDSLAELDVDGTPDFIPLLEACTRLTKMEHFVQSSKTMAKIGRKSRAPLKDATFFGTDEFTDRGLAAVAPALSQVERLTIDGPRITEAGVLKIVFQCPKLRQLEISQTLQEKIHRKLPPQVELFEQS